MTETSTPGRDQTAVSTFVERFAGLLTEAGMPRIASRVFVALLATDSGRLTAAELSEQLQASPAAISGAVRYLIQIDLAIREREPGSRRDHYRVRDDVWYESITNRDQMMFRWQASLDKGVEALGSDTPAGSRVAETREFFEFMHQEMRLMRERWREYRAEMKRKGDSTD